MARKKKDNIEQDIQVTEQDNNKENNTKQNKDIIVPDNVSRDTRTLEQKLNSYKRKLRRL